MAFLLRAVESHPRQIAEGLYAYITDAFPCPLDRLKVRDEGEVNPLRVLDEHEGEVNPGAMAEWEEWNEANPPPDDE